MNLELRHWWAREARSLLKIVYLLAQAEEDLMGQLDCVSLFS